MDVDMLVAAAVDAMKSHITPSRPFTLRYIGGNCPVQAEGAIGGKEFYFRARGNSWSMSIGGDDVVLAPEFYHKEEWGDGPYAAGWMPLDVAIGFIAKAIGLYCATPTPQEGEK